MDAGLIMASRSLRTLATRRLHPGDTPLSEIVLCPCMSMLGTQTQTAEPIAGSAARHSLGVVGSPAFSERPVALRPCLTAGLPFSPVLRLSYVNDYYKYAYVKHLMSRARQMKRPINCWSFGRI